VTEDGQIPRDEEENWSNGRLNNFRQNVQPGGLFDAPDLVVSVIIVEGCSAAGEAQIAVTVTNLGALGVPPGVKVHVTATSGDGVDFEVGVVETTTRLLPGASETIRLDWAPAGGWTFDAFSVAAAVDDDGTGAGEFNECHEDNNEAVSEVEYPDCSIG
jgi:hypothetical protein